MRKSAAVFLSAFTVCACLAPTAPIHAADTFDASLFSVKLSGPGSGLILKNAASTFVISSSEDAFTLPNTPFQRVSASYARGGRRYICLVTGPARGVQDAPSRGDLDDTAFLNLDSGIIQKLSENFSGESDKIAAVERFVYRYIHDKTLGIPILPAEKIAQERAGDCTEHSVLTVALLRSLGIPARAVVGMIFTEEFGGLRNVFVFHMWVEAYRNGAWVMVDSTRPGGVHPNRYIAFARHHLQTGMPLSYLRAVASIKNLTVAYNETAR